MSCWLRRKASGISPVYTCSAAAAVEQKEPHAMRRALFCFLSNRCFMLSDAELYAIALQSISLNVLNFYR